MAHAVILALGWVRGRSMRANLAYMILCLKRKTIREELLWWVWRVWRLRLCSKCLWPHLWAIKPDNPAYFLPTSVERKQHTSLAWLFSNYLPSIISSSHTYVWTKEGCWFLAGNHQRECVGWKQLVHIKGKSLADKGSVPQCMRLLQPGGYLNMIPKPC